MSKRSVTVCDGCGDYGPEVAMAAVRIAERAYDNCPACINKVERIAGATLLPAEPAVIPKLELDTLPGPSPFMPPVPPTPPPHAAVPLSPLLPTKG